MAGGTLTYDPAAMYGLPRVSDAGAVGDATPLSSIATSASGAAARAWHPDNPLFWIAGLLAAAFGFAFASTTIRVGPASGTVKIGDEK